VGHLLDQGHDMNFILDPRGNIVDVNKKACHRLGMKRAELIGTSFRSVTRGESYLYGTGDRKVPVGLRISLLPKGKGPYQETLAAATEISPEAVWKYLEFAGRSSQNPEDREKFRELSQILIPTRMENPAIKRYRITPQELKIMRLISEGLTSAEIADQLGTSYKTVDAQKKVIYEKLDVPNASAMVQKANNLSLIGKNAY
jgi:DNA-binding CsgD family transcriptional regulator